MPGGGRCHLAVWCVSVRRELGRIVQLRGYPFVIVSGYGAVLTFNDMLGWDEKQAAQATLFWVCQALWERFQLWCGVVFRRGLPSVGRLSCDALGQSGGIPNNEIYEWFDFSIIGNS